MQIKNGALGTDELTAYDAAGAAVTGLVNGDWTKKLYNPSGSEVSGSVTVTVTELGFGGYRATFTPNALGQWLLILTNAANDLALSNNYECLTGIVADVYADTDAIDSRLPSDPADESLQQAAHATTQAAIAALNDPTVDAIADQVWEETIGDHSGTAGSTAEALANAGTSPGAIADAVWEEALGDHSGTGGSAAEALVEVQTDVNSIDSRLPSDPADESLQQAAHAVTQADIAALNDPTVDAIADQVWEETLADHSGTAGSTAEALANSGTSPASIADAVWEETLADHSGTAGSAAEALAEVQTDVNAIDSRLPSDPADESIQLVAHATTQAAIAALNDPTVDAIADQVWEETLTDHSGTAGSTAEALAACSAVMTGAYQIDVTVEDGGAVPVQGALIDVYDATNTNFLAQFYTDINGEVSLALDAGTYNLRVWATGYSFTVPEVVVVAGDAPVTIVGTAGVVISPPSQPDLCVVYGYVYDAGGQPVGGACVSAVPTLPQAVDDKQQAERAIHTATREDGYFEIELVRTAEVRFEIEFTDYSEIKTVPDTASQEFTSWS